MGRKGGFDWIASHLKSRHSPNFWTNQSCFLLTTVFFRVRASVYWSTDPGHNWTRWTKHKAIRPGFKNYIPARCNALRHKNLTQFMQSLSHVRQNQVIRKISKRKALLAGGQQALFSCWPLVKIKNASSTVFLPVFNTAVVCDYSVMVLFHSCLIKSVFFCAKGVHIEAKLLKIYGKKSWHWT